MTIHQNGASAARPAITHFFCPCEIEPISQRVEQGDAWLDIELPILAINIESDGGFFRAKDTAFLRDRLLETNRGKQARRHRSNPDAFEESPA